MKRLISLALILGLCSVALAGDVSFVASMKSNKYHYPSCRVARLIKPQNLILFNSPEAAIKMGYSPCKICLPPTETEMK